MKDKKIIPFQKLVVWQKSIELSIKIYKTTETFPKSELYSLTSQIRRSSISISSNIAEGSFRGSEKEFLRFLFIAYGSGAELQTQLEIAKRLNFINRENFEKLNSEIVEIMKILNDLINNIKKVVG